jgi:hypothetical protein
MQWLTDYHVGDLASIASVAISIVGFIITVWNVRRSKSAAERAESAANDARRMIRGYETLADLSAAIAIMEEIRRLHRVGQIDPLLDRYAALRKVLTEVRKMSPSVNEPMNLTIQNAITTLADMEALIERSRAAGRRPNFVRLNQFLSHEIDELHAVFVDMKLAEGSRS